MNGPISNSHIELTPYPSSLLSGRLPPPSSRCWNDFFEYLERRPKIDPKYWADEVKELYAFLSQDPAANHFFKLACDQNETLKKHVDVQIPRIRDAEVFASKCNYLLTQWPRFHNKILVGLPFSALASGIDATLSGSKCLSLPGFNEAMSKVLQKWNKYLESPDSAEGFSVEGAQWLTDEAKKMYDYELWAKESESLPYWKSWNSFFVRQFKDPAKERPIASPSTNQIINSPNDGQLFRWDWDIKEDNLFWFKDMNYSLRNILSSPDPCQQKLIEDYGLVNRFLGGYVFQTFLNPYDYHRWWAPVNGKVLFDPIIVPGVFFNKLTMPDFEGSSTASLPYLCQVNTRGIVVFDTEDYGYVCCIPIGMNEVSTVVFNEDIKKDTRIKKGHEIGMFKFGGSSFAIIFEKLEGKELVFHKGEHKGLLPPRPKLPTSANSSDGTKVRVGSQIAMWYDIGDLGKYREMQ